jgi:hypothetical protein
MSRLAMCAFALLWAGCGDDASGPVLRSGPWYGYLMDQSNQVRGVISADVALDGKVHVKVEGFLSDGTTPFSIESNAAVLREGSNFSISGTEGINSVSGYGRERVFDTLFEVAIPIDNIPAHQLTVGTENWEFQIQAGMDTDQATGSWAVHSLVTGTLNVGSFMAQPGILPPPDAEDIDAPADGPTDAGTD